MMRLVLRERVKQKMMQKYQKTRHTNNYHSQLSLKQLSNVYNFISTSSVV